MTSSWPRDTTLSTASQLLFDVYVTDQDSAPVDDIYLHVGFESSPHARQPLYYFNAMIPTSDIYGGDGIFGTYSVDAMHSVAPSVP